jgi:hypothetical protein
VIQSAIHPITHMPIADVFPTKNICFGAPCSVEVSSSALIRPFHCTTLPYRQTPFFGLRIENSKIEDLRRRNDKSVNITHKK